jgi:prepilin-type N-terminal cleavage/methylation domain-containing protein
MSSRGFSLLELLIVIAMIGIVSSIATLDFKQMMNKGRMETQTKEIYSELVKLRIDSMQKKQRSAAFLGPNQIIFRRYSSDRENILTGGNTATLRPVIKTLPFEIRSLTGATQNVLNVTTDRIVFDARGYTNDNPDFPQSRTVVPGYANDNLTLVILPVTFNSGDNCILVNVARINIGRMADASTCTAH